MVKFTTTLDEARMIAKVVDRALKYGTISDKKGGRRWGGGWNSPRLSLQMDLSAVHSNGCPLNFTRLMAFSDSDFEHDILGIMSNINRDDGGLLNCFLPRCAKPTPKPELDAGLALEEIRGIVAELMERPDTEAVHGKLSDIYRLTMEGGA